MTLAAMMADLAEHYEKKTAIFFQDQKISYDELNETANRIANSLLEKGIEKGDNVAILLPNRPEFVQSFFGIVKAGAVAVMVNTSFKTGEIRYILNNSQSAFLITTEKYFDRISDKREELANLKEIFIIADDPPSNLSSYSELLFGKESEPEIAIETDDPAGIIYTSGITGFPKGAVLTNGNYFSNIQKLVQAAGLGYRTRMMCVLPLFHVLAMTFNMLAPLYAGGSIILTRGFSAREFLPALSRYKVTSLIAVPTVFAILNELPDKDKYDLSSLTLCISGAAPLDVKTVNRFEALYKANVIEGYGLTEATCAVCLNPVDGRRKVGSIGIPLPGMEVQVVDEDDYEVGVDEIGQLIVRGDSVMLGYYNDKEGTEEALRDGWLYTGDLGMVDEDGYFFITGRIKELIIRGGENIYPKEVERVLMDDPRVEEAAVIGVPDNIWGEAVLAYITKAPDARISRQEVIDLAKSKLADFKAPTIVKFIQKLPKTVTGKIRKALLFKMSLDEEQ